MIACASFSTKGWTVTASVRREDGTRRTFGATKPSLEEARAAVMLQIDHALLLGDAYPPQPTEE